MKLKLNIEITADNYEEMLKAIDSVKKDYDLGALSLSSESEKGYQYNGEVTEID